LLKNSDFGVAQRFERFDKAFFSARALAAGPLKRVFQFFSKLFDPEGHFSSSESSSKKDRAALELTVNAQNLLSPPALRTRT